MYIGSVRFFKHLILTIFALMIIIPVTLAVYFAHSYFKANEQIEILQQRLALLEQESGSSNNTGWSENGHGVTDVPASSSSDDAYTYHAKYPQLYVENDFQYTAEAERTIYLTFDDGPTNLTSQVLDVLRDRGVRATFFVVYRNSNDAKELYRRIVNEGHAIGIHSATHNYQQIYQSVESFLDDMAVLSDLIVEVTGVKPELIRFPGGSVNNYNKNIYKELIAEIHRRGYTYHDWDVSSGSSTNTATKSSIYSQVINGIANLDKAIVLMHDAGTAATVYALPEIIDSIKSSGYKLEALDKTIKPTQFDF